MVFRWVRTQIHIHQGDNSPESAQKRTERSEFGFTETLSAATILVPQAIALDAAETEKNLPPGLTLPKWLCFSRSHVASQHATANPH